LPNWRDFFKTRRRSEKVWIRGWVRKAFSRRFPPLSDLSGRWVNNERTEENNYELIQIKSGNSNRKKFD